MLGIGEFIYNVFSPLGSWGMLLCIFLLFYIDAIVFPTLPELFTVIIYMAIPELWFAGAILVTIAVAEILGLSTLYYITKSIKVPGRIERFAERYRRFLILGDERMIIINRFAPVIPLMGAFVQICNWSFKKSLFYTVLSGTIKYGAILAASQTFFVYFSEGVAELATIIMVLVILALSLVVSLYKKSKMRDEDEDCPT